MAIDNTIHKHLDRVEDIEADTKEDIIKIYNKMNIKGLLKNTDETITAMINQILLIVVNKRMKQIYKESKGFTKSVIAESN